MPSAQPTPVNASPPLQPAFNPARVQVLADGTCVELPETHCPPKMRCNPPPPHPVLCPPK
jgi:hypothetical protein